MTIAVIADIVGSRRLADRADAQRALEDAIAQVEHDYPVAMQPLRPTVGDELQALFPTIETSLCSILLLQLALPESIRCRFGIGIGEVGTIASTTGALPDGPGWWAAREAINKVHALEQRTAPTARAWIVAAQGQHEGVHSSTSMANAYLLSRDEIVSAMSARARRLTYGRCINSKQSDLARAEGISQPAVSQALAAAGSAAVVEGFFALSGSVS
ncbi:SatD family protein [Microbacterium sp. NPDC076911]|uniref:SatD family protein n=1 Tax=Microbacterium sp. NPDC076911 TaxID=3154958 RepID=UPI00343EE646